MQVKMTRLAAGPGGIYPVGSEPDLPEELALAFIEAGAAEVVKTPPPTPPPPKARKAKGEGGEAEIEAAVFEPTENAMRPAATKRPARKRGG